MSRNDELKWLFTNRFSATRYMKVKRMGITKILRRIWLFPANKIKSSESVSKQPTQLILAAENRHIVSCSRDQSNNEFQFDWYKFSWFFQHQQVFHIFKGQFNCKYFFKIIVKTKSL